MTRGDVVDLLEEYALLLDLLNEEGIRSKAFANAARQLSTVGASLEELLVGNRLSMVKGIGPSLVQVIRESAETGTFAELEATRLRVPRGVLDLLKVEGLGPKKAQTLWLQGKITSLEDLDAAIDSGRLATLSGFGGKTLERFRASIAFIRRCGARKLRHHARAVVEKLTHDLQGIPGIVSVHFCGSYRRHGETVGDLDCVVCADIPRHSSIRECILGHQDITWSSTESDIWTGRHSSEIDIELSICAPSELGTKLVQATGSKAHLAELRKHGELPLSSTEEEVYGMLGLESVPPPLREEGLALRKKGQGPYSEQLKRQDVRGILHVHTTYSDGQHSLRQMAEAMIARGYEFLGIADHSKVAAYARGLDRDRVYQQWEEIDDLNSELAPFRILRGTECDILPDGTLDFDDSLLSQFDFVVASIHSGFGMSVDQATDRICRALENPHVDILGHPTGRLLLKREGYPIDHDRVIECASRNGKAIELNCSPHRLDLDWRWYQTALELGVPIPLNPDAHQASGLDEIDFGLELAAKGPIPASLCPSTWTASEFISWCNSHN
ncbi:hypothetical protein HUU59_03830 [bacterium]|nr:hypothetical protein [bacterium]